MKGNTNNDNSSSDIGKIYQALTERSNFTVQEFADLTGRSYTTIRSNVAAENGAIKSTVVGKGGKNSPKYSIPASELENFVNNQKFVGRPRKSDTKY